MGLVPGTAAVAPEVGPGPAGSSRYGERVWKQRVNEVLRRVSGHQLNRVGSEPDPSTGEPGLRRRLDRSQQRLDELRRQLRTAERERGRAAARARRLENRLRQTKEIPSHYDEAARQVLQRVSPRTMTDHAKLFGLVEATRYLVRNGIDGDVVECGVWRGGSMQAVALTLQELDASDRDLHLFDTFEGMPPPSDKDRRGDTTAQELLSGHDKDHRVWAVAGRDDVEEAMREVGYPSEHVHFHQGMVEDTVPGRAPDRIALLRLDTDWYESTLHELEHLYPRLVPGGVLILDDYGDWEGARQATDEYLARIEEPLLLLPLGSGRLAVKPGR